MHAHTILTESRMISLVAVERTTASISTLSLLILLSTFAFIPKLRTLTNRLIVYASLANIAASVAALIGGGTTVYRPSEQRQGSPEPLFSVCRVQALLLESAMQSDPWWSCAMAINVWLCLFMRFDQERLKRMHVIYAIVCYGGPAFAGIFCFFYRPHGVSIYGDAQLWCWISDEYALVRIWSYYLPIWVAIIASIIIYIVVGMKVWKTRAGVNSQRYATYGPNSNSNRITTRTELNVNDMSRSTNNLHQAQHGSHDYITTIEAGIPRPCQRLSVFRRLLKLNKTMDKVKKRYLMTSLFFAVSVVVTWLPPSTNRVYQLTVKDPNPTTAFALAISSSTVLPLQGFWNTLIYFFTSRKIVKEVLADFWRERARAKAARGPRERGPYVQTHAESLEMESGQSGLGLNQGVVPPGDGFRGCSW